MRVGQAACVYKGSKFTGTYEVSGEGPAEKVHVRYGSEDIEVETGGLPPEAVAETVLRNLVSWNAIHLKGPLERPSAPGARTAC
jgi:hypothetical protein